MSASNGQAKIENNIPIPAHRGNNRYPWEEVKIGESFVIATDNKNSAQALVYHSAKKFGRKFVTRKVDGGVRVWRTA